MHCNKTATPFYKLVNCDWNENNKSLVFITPAGSIASPLEPSLPATLLSTLGG